MGLKSDFLFPRDQTTEIRESLKRSASFLILRLLWFVFFLSFSPLLFAVSRRLSKFVFVFAYLLLISPANLYLSAALKILSRVTYGWNNIWSRLTDTTRVPTVQASEPETSSPLVSWEYGLLLYTISCIWMLYVIKHNRIRNLIEKNNVPENKEN